MLFLYILNSDSSSRVCAHHQSAAKLNESASLGDYFTLGRLYSAGCLKFHQLQISLRNEL